MIKEAIVKIVNKEDLTYDEAYAVMNEIMGGETTQTQNAAFLAALSTKSAKAETTDEIAGCAAAMREHAVQVKTGMDVFEIVGTGGDNAQSFNISTTSALVAAAGGMKVAKHGNRAASSLCGTADCLEALGVNIDQSPDKCVELLNKVGMCFFFAQKYHLSMKYVGTIRKELGFRTVFNILGPLTNPGTPSMQLLGVYDEYLVEKIYDSDILFVEANHDVNMLQVGRYPYYLKRRILGREGHLSNERCAELIEEVATQKTKKVYLGHLSKENNYEKLAYETVKISLHNFTLPIEVARRDTVSTVTSVS